MEVEEKFSDTDKIQFILVPKREPNDEECVKNVKSSWPPQEESTCNEDHREPITEKVKDENQHMSQDFNILVDDLLKDSANPNSDVKVKSEQDTEEPEENFQDLVESRVAEPNPSDYEISTPQETVESESDSSESHSPKRKRRNTTSKTLPVVAATSNEIQTLSSDSDSEEDFNILVDDLLKGSANSNSDVIVESEPDTEEPEDNVQDLVESWDAEPNPSDTESNLSDAERNPSDAEPNPSDTEPNPSDAEPDPSNAERNPSNAEPNPSHAEPNPSNAETNPSHAEPNPSNAERDPSNAEPDPSCAEPDPSDDEISTIQETVESGSDHGESHCPKRKRRNTTSKTLPVVAATSNDIQTLSSDSDSEEDEDTSAPIPGEVCTGIQDGILCQCERCKMCVKKIERSIDKDDTSKDSHKPLSCNICNLRFIYKSRLEKHLKVHKGLKLFPCDICNRAFAQKGGLKAHIERKHSTNKCKRVQTKKEICNICNKEISTHRLKNHIETVHFRKIESLLFRCKDCGKGFSHKENLKVHTDAVHLREKQYKCAECHKVFKNKPILSYHIQTSHQQREEYICAICDRTYYTKNSLSLHINIHSGTTVVPVCCEICGKAVKNEYKLKTHMLVHNDDHKFSCQNCGKLFKRLHNLKQHENTHKDSRPHVCTICGQTFKLRTHVKQHMAVHGNIKNHKCVVCEKTFARKTQLYTHMSTHGL
ncbi:zinc finger and BTB domain-containing protein 41-like isoform X2 [Macrosteles quadrilineatus]|uniref:zinc finger and BTB domain-containing protein 41-like isoform X2 n=2 Tax=Macrosteles quadrilineatus TaxID=74068 RepID=UPI0023E2577F|nr:zinc finger and BTB domain-containing protein 41-like isoform X2 [Macrosteles quadrilineatus]